MLFFSKIFSANHLHTVFLFSLGVCYHFLLFLRSHPWTKQYATWVLSLCSDPSFPRNTHQYNFLLSIVWCPLIHLLVDRLIIRVPFANVYIYLEYSRKKETPAAQNTNTDTIAEKAIFQNMPWFKQCTCSKSYMSTSHLQTGWSNLPKWE